MTDTDIILDGSRMPSYDEITGYINMPVRELWKNINHFIRERYKTVPVIAYSACSGKPGWNVKYRRAGKSICTLYPEKDCFIALVVITLDLLPVIEALSGEITEEVIRTVREAKPLNGTKWLMLKIENERALQDVKQLLILKQDAKRAAIGG